MRSLFLLILLIYFSTMAFAQSSDFIVLKKKNNRTLKTYFPGSFISASTYTGFTLNGIIKQIKNDSIFIEQQEVRQFASQFGVPVLDTIVYSVRLHYEEIRVFDYSTVKLGGSSKRNGGLIQSILIIGGTGFIMLELVNTLYRGESLSDDNKLTALVVAAGVAATGLLWKYLQNRSNKPGKYKVVYVHMSTKKRAF